MYVYLYIYIQREARTCISTDGAICLKKKKMVF